MCTVSFVPLHDKIFIAHNRDEKSSRGKAIHPAAYTIKGYKLLFPRDSTAGGTWIACNASGSAAVLLNGAVEKHVQSAAYRKSRGLVFLDILAAGDLYRSFCEIDLEGIEPFTIILWTESKLYECRWNGLKKNSARLDALLPHSWSSVTLYDETIVEKRKNWFKAWVSAHAQPSMDELVQFHLLAGDGDVQNDLRMSRDGLMLTVSVTAMELTEHKCTMKYLDLQDDTISQQELIFTKAAAIQ